MNTWNAELPPELPPSSVGGRIAGVLRMTAFLLLTALALAIFITGRTLRAWLGRWVTYHFVAARLWSRAGLWLTGLSLVVRGTPVASGALVSNHCSWADILALRSVRLMYFVAKAEVRRWPAVGFITAVTGTVFIERRRSQAKRQEQVLRERIGASQLLIFFPEGTSTDGLRVLPFKSSLFSAFFQLLRLVGRHGAGGTHLGGDEPLVRRPRRGDLPPAGQAQGVPRPQGAGRALRRRGGAGSQRELSGKLAT
jgi:1-acyl-sn-glycerol-3-phosphate acyltransferase